MNLTTYSLFAIIGKDYKRQANASQNLTLFEDFMEFANFRRISCFVLLFVAGCPAQPVGHKPESDIAASQSAKFLKDIEFLWKDSI